MSQLTLPEFADKINEVFPVVIRHFLKKQSNELYKGRITLPQIVILDILHREGETRMTDLAHFMGVTTAAMTGLVDRLVRDGYVERVSDPADRRIIKIKTTNRGGMLIKKITQQKRQMIIDMFGKLSQQERQDYLRIILRLRDVLTGGQEDEKS